VNLENTNTGLFVSNYKGNLVQISNAMYTLSGYPLHSMLQESFIAFFLPTDHTKLIELSENLLMTGQEFTMVSTLKGAEQNIPVNISATAAEGLMFMSVQAIDAETDKKLVNIQDIANRELAEEQLQIKQQALEQAEANFLELFEKGNEGLFVYEIETGVMLEVNQKACEILGYTKEAILSLPKKHFETDIPGYGAKELVSYFEKAVMGKPQVVEWVIKLASDKTLWVEISLKRATFAGKQRVLTYFRNIEDRKKAEQEKEFERNKTAALINNTNDLIWSVDEQFRLIAANKSFTETVRNLFGIEAKPGYELLLPDHYSESILTLWASLYSKALKGEPVAEEVYTPASAQMKDNWAEITFNPIYQNEKIIGVACYGRDITEKKQNQLKLQESKAQLVIGQQIAKLGGWKMELASKKVSLSNEAYNVFDIETNDFDGTFKDLESLIHPDDVEGFLTSLQDAISEETIFNCENRIVTKNGLVKTVIQKGYLVYDHNNQPIEFRAIIQDHTDIKEAALQLEQSNERFEYVTKATSDAVYDWDIENDVILWGKAYATLFGEEDFKTMFSQKEWAKRIHADDYEAVKNNLQDALYKSTRNDWITEYRFKKTDGTYAYIIENGYIIRDIEGKPYRMIGALRDITERKLSEEKLRASEENRSLIMNAALDAIIWINTEGNITFWNPQAAQIFGWSEAEVMHKDLSSFIIPAMYHKAHNDGMKKFLTTGHGPALNKLLNLTAVNKDGVTFPIEITIIPIKQKEEEFFCAFIRDITERKKAEDSIRISNERYDLVAKATNDFIWDWDINSNEVTRIGNGFTTLFGYENTDENTVVGFWDELIHPDDLDRIKRSQQEKFYSTNESYWEIEYQFLKADGTYAHVYDKGYIIRDRTGKPLRMIGATQDVTQLKEKINEITRIKQNLDSLINTTNDRIWSINSQYRVIASNSANNEYLYKAIGKHINEGDLLVNPSADCKKTAEIKGYYDRALQGESFNIEEDEFSTEDNEHKYTVFSFSPIVDSFQQIAGVACYAKDITDIKKSSQRLNQLNIELQDQAGELAASNAELERFAYVASHDLQEPLRMVTGFLKLLEKQYKDNLDEASSKYIHFAVDGAERMKKLILDLLEYSRVSTNKELVSNVNMNEVLKDVLQIMDARIKKIPCTIRFNQLPTLKAASRTQMFQLLQNLIGNALKYHSDPPCEIEIEATEQELDWLFKIKDNGIGFDPQFAERVFVIFQRLHNKSEYSGTGIGLSICKKIVERHGGKIWAVSEKGKGSTFYFSLTK
jgi:PAS domain S-box-containing protein